MVRDRVFAWAREYDDEQRAAFIEDLWAAAGKGDDLATLDAIEQAIAAHAPEPEPCPLTARQLDVLTQLANGETHQSAGRRLGMSANAVRNLSTELYARLGVRNVAQAAAVAVHRGWLRDLNVPDCPPRPAKLGPRAWSVIYRDAVVRMLQQPGVPVEIGPYGSHSGAHNGAWRIRKGLLKEVQAAGVFEAQPVRTDAGRFLVIARYLGDATDTTTHDTAPEGTA